MTCPDQTAGQGNVQARPQIVRIARTEHGDQTNNTNPDVTVENLEGETNATNPDATADNPEGEANGTPCPDQTVGQGDAQALRPNWRDGEESSTESDLEMQEKRALCLANTLEHVICYEDRLLDEEEWTDFERLMDEFLKDAGKLTDKNPHRHPTTHWRRRVRNRQEATEQPVPRNSGERRRGSRNRNEALAARRIQLLYKKAMRVVLEEEGPRCKSTVSDMEQFFNARGDQEEDRGPAPPWLRRR